MKFSLFLGPSGLLEAIPFWCNPLDVLPLGPLHTSKLKSGWALHWCSGSYCCAAVNDYATLASSTLVRGEALVHGEAPDQETLLGHLEINRWGSLKQQVLAALAFHNGPRVLANNSHSTQYGGGCPCKEERHINFGACRASGAVTIGLPAGVSGRKHAILNRHRPLSPHQTPSLLVSSSDGKEIETRRLSGVKNPMLGRRSQQCMTELDPPAACTGSSTPAKKLGHQHSGVALLVGGSSSPWQDLYADVVSRVAGQLCSSVVDVLAMAQVCSSWRQAVYSSMDILRQIELPSPQVKVWARGAQGGAQSLQWPMIVEKAVQAGNVSAMVFLAKCLDGQGRGQEGMRLWKKAGKAGHVEALWKVGMAAYNGQWGIEKDVEDAHLHLSRVVKQVLEVSNLSGERCSSRALPGSSFQVNASLKDQILSQAGLVLGYLHFDGEGNCGVSRSEAVRYFKLAAQHGSKEAEEVLGWVFNTGQYG